MDDPSVDANLYGDPSSSILSDQLLGDEEARVAADETARRTRIAERQEIDDEIRRSSQSPRWGSQARPTSSSGRSVSGRSGPEIDMRSLEYTLTVDLNLLCAICHCPFVEPIGLKCEHVFCKDCLDGALEHQNEHRKTCPTCRQRINRESVIAAPKIIDRIIDDLMIKCPMYEVGCTEVMARGAINHHLTRYCGHYEVKCPDKKCKQGIQRRHLKDKCLHRMTKCPACDISIMVLEADDHLQKVCEVASLTCPDCEATMPRSEFQSHILECPNTVLSCTASPYGCDFKAMRSAFGDHITTCPLSKLVPFLETQQARLREHEAALDHLRRKNNLYEDCLSKVQESLSESLLDVSSLTLAPFDSTAGHLLDLHESLRKEVERVATTVSDLDAKTDMNFINNSLRTKEEMAHTSAILNQMRIQLVSENLLSCLSGKLYCSTISYEFGVAQKTYMRNSVPHESKLLIFCSNG